MFTQIGIIMNMSVPRYWVVHEFCFILIWFPRWCLKINVSFLILICEMAPWCDGILYFGLISVSRIFIFLKSENLAGMRHLFSTRKNRRGRQEKFSESELSYKIKSV